MRNYLVQVKHIAKQRQKAVGKDDHELMHYDDPTTPENRRVTIVNLSQ